MEFLKAILGEALFTQFEQAINEHNGKPENAEKQVKLADLGSGEYVSKGKYSTLEAENQTNASKLTEANNLIAQLQKAAKGDEALQGQVTAYQQRVQELETELAQTKLDNAIKVELLSSKALDVDYLTFKLKEKGELTLDDDGKIKGWDDKLAALKTQFPTQFETATGNSSGYKVLEPNRLNQGDPGEKTPTKEEFKAMTYEQRVALKQKNENLYKTLKQ